MAGILNPFFYADNPKLLAYENSWVDFIKNDAIPIESVISKEITDSWILCKKSGMDATVKKIPSGMISETEVEIRLANNKDVLELALKYLNKIMPELGREAVSVEYYDHEGYLLYKSNDDRLQHLIDMTDTYVGCNRSEEVVGTYAVGLALKTKKAIQTTGAQNYLQLMHNWTGSAAPILDENKEVTGVINIGGNYESAHVHTLALVSAIAKAVENELYIKKINAQLQISNVYRETLMSICTDGILFVIDGVIVQINQEMCKFIGKSEADILGQRLDEILEMSPSFDRISDGGVGSTRDGKLVFRCQNGVYRCIYHLRNVDSGNGKSGTLLSVTRIDEIQDLSKKITNVAEYTFDDIICESNIMKDVVDMAKVAASHDARVLITGKSGTGKELLAQAIHNGSSRRYNSFVAVDCGAIPRELFESEMFGYVKGAFTGASEEGKTGLMELADGGTLFLDEVGNLPLDMQAKLLRVLQQGYITRVGDTKNIPVDVRVIAATNAVLDKLVEEKAFREDLFYRLNVISIKIPPLKARKEDISPIIRQYLYNISVQRNKLKSLKFTPAAMNCMINYEWPGNIRQLLNCIDRLLILHNRSTIDVESLPLEVQGGIRQSTIKIQSGMSLDEVTKEYIKRVLDECGGNVTQAAEILKISRATVYNRIGVEHDR